MDIIMKKKINSFVLKATTVVLLAGLSSYSLASTEVSSEKHSFKEVEKLATDDNNSEAQLLLGFYYFMGKEVKQDYAKAFKFFTKASEHGISEGTTMLGIMYLQGLGVEKNQTKAEELLIKAETMKAITGS